MPKLSSKLNPNSELRDKRKIERKPREQNRKDFILRKCV